ncbi:hypothetical protein [Paraclostridium dentum]|uniref:hypothetical protein n=1 Tax=Paraclostridium dentum TaxID=2662455 RepID=UPI003F3EE323
MLFSLYLLPLGFILEKHSLSFHCYADDIQIYLPLGAKMISLQSLFLCLKELKSWMAQKLLFLNETKTEYILFSRNISVDLTSMSQIIKQSVRNLVVILGSNVNLENPIRAVVKSSFFQL